MERSQEELIDLLGLLPQKSRDRVRDALADAESGSAGKSAVEQALDPVLQPEEAAQNFVCLGYSAFVRELCELGVGVDFTPMQAKDLAGAFLTKLLIVGSARLNPTHNTFEPFWREAERKALKSEAEKEFRDELRDARLRELEFQQSDHGTHENARPVGAANAEFRHSAPRLKATITSPVAVKRMDAYLAANGIGLTEFATTVKTTDRTLRTFRRTGRIRRDIFTVIAAEMGFSKEELLRPE
ncbi:MAG: hypothetical protein ACR2JB_19030 [Bryobacteraceae bacterium]